MSDVSSNDVIIIESEESSENEQGQTENEETQSEVIYSDSYDYSSYLANIQNNTFFISALLYSLILLVAFVGGVQNGKR